MKDFNFVETLKEGIKKFKDFFKLQLIIYHDVTCLTSQTHET